MTISRSTVYTSRAISSALPCLHAVFLMRVQSVGYGFSLVIEPSRSELSAGTCRHQQWNASCLDERLQLVAQIIDGESSRHQMRGCFYITNQRCSLASTFLNVRAFLFGRATQSTSTETRPKVALFSSEPQNAFRYLISAPTPTLCICGAGAFSKCTSITHHGGVESFFDQCGCCFQVSIFFQNL